MKLNWVRGKIAEKDRIIRMTTEKDEPVTIFKLALLTNQLAVNELAVHAETILRTGKFFFKNAIIDAIKMADEGIDWGEEKNIVAVKRWCKKYMLDFEKIEPELRKIIQKKVCDFK